MKYISLFFVIGCLAFVNPNARLKSLNLSTVGGQDTVIVCMGPSAKTYHNRLCNGLMNCSREQKRVAIDEALTMSRRQCMNCYKTH